MAAEVELTADTSSKDTSSKSVEAASLPTTSVSKDGGNGTPNSAIAREPLSGVAASPDQSTAVLTYLQKRGFTREEAAFKAELDAYNSGATSEQATAAADAHGRPSTVTIQELAAKNAPRAVTDKDNEEKEKAKDQDKLKDKSKAKPLQQKDNPFRSTDAEAEVPPETDASAAAAQALLLDPTDRARGFSMLRSWCQGSLDIYQQELLPILLPLFVHSFLDLVSMGYASAATAFYAAHADSFLPTHATLLSQIRSLALPSHIQSDSLAQRFRTERYVVKMSNTVFSLLLGWLTDGFGPVSGATAGTDEAEAPVKRGREAMLKVINERCRIQVLAIQPYQIDSSILEEGTGLTGAGPSFSSSTSGPSTKSRHHPALEMNAVAEVDAVAEFNAKAAGPQLKLHPSVPLSERLETEVEKEIQEIERKEKEETAALQQPVSAAESTSAAQADTTETLIQDTASSETQPQQQLQDQEPKPLSQQRQQDGDTTMEEATSTATAKPADSSAAAAANRDRTSSARPLDPAVNGSELAAVPDFSAGLLAASIADLPPQAPTFRTADVKREVQKIKDARKRIRLDPSLLHGGGTGVRDGNTIALGEQGTRAARTAALPSVCAYTYHDAEDGVTCSTFSADVSLMAAGFEESFIQLWSLKGEKLRGLRGDPSLGGVKDSRTLRKQREQEGYSTRKLIGHSGPVYGIDFDPIGGSASSPRHLLSCSADGTTRLWSLDTYSALVSYRGHQWPVWDIKWSPMGTYFATASADKTARLWSTERVNPLRMYAGHLSDVDCLAFHPNSLYLATGSSDRSCRLWDVQRGACVRLFVGHQSPISCVRISPDGRYLASAATGNGTASHFAEGFDPTSSGGNNSNDVSISLWDLASGRRIKKMWGHQQRVDSMDFSADGSLLVTGSNDCTVRCWDVRSIGGVRKLISKASLESQQTCSSTSLLTNGSNADMTTISKAIQGSSTTMKASDLVGSSSDCVATFYTKKTSIIDVHFTPRNLCLVAGVYNDGDDDD